MWALPSPLEPLGGGGGGGVTVTSLTTAGRGLCVGVAEPLADHVARRARRRCLHRFIILMLII